MIPNGIAYTDKISLTAKGLYLYISAKPEGWAFSAYRIAEELGCGECVVKSARRELIEAGFLRMERVRNSGQFGNYRYFLNTSPAVDFPPVVSPLVDSPPVENRTDNKERNKNTFSQKKEKEAKTSFQKKRNSIEAGKAKERAKFERWAQEANEEAEKERTLTETKKKVLQWMRENPIELAEMEKEAKRLTENANPHLSGRLLDPMIRVRVRAMVAKKISNLSENG